MQILVRVLGVGHLQAAGDDVRKVEGERRRGEVHDVGERRGVHHREPRVDEVDELLVEGVVRADRVRQEHRVGVRRALRQDVVVLQRVQARLVQLLGVRALNLVDLEIRHRGEAREPAEDGVELLIRLGCDRRLRRRVELPRLRQVALPRSLVLHPRRAAEQNPTHRLRTRHLLRLRVRQRAPIVRLGGGPGRARVRHRRRAAEIRAKTITPHQRVRPRGLALGGVLGAVARVLELVRGVRPRGVVQRDRHGGPVGDVEVVLVVEEVLALVQGQARVDHRAVELVLVLHRGEVSGEIIIHVLARRVGLVCFVDGSVPDNHLEVQHVVREGQVAHLEVRLDRLVRPNLRRPSHLRVVRREQQALILRLFGHVELRPHRPRDFQEDILLHHDRPVPVRHVVDLAHDVPDLFLEPLVLLVVAVRAVKNLPGPDQLVHLQRAQVPLGVLHEVDGRNRPLRVGEVVVDVHLDGGDVGGLLEQVAVRLAPEAAVLGVLERRLAPTVAAPSVLPRRGDDRLDPRANVRAALHRRGGGDEVVLEGAREHVRLLGGTLEEQDRQVERDEDEEREEGDVIRLAIFLFFCKGFFGKKGGEKNENFVGGGGVSRGPPLQEKKREAAGGEGGTAIVRCGAGASRSGRARPRGDSSGPRRGRRGDRSGIDDEPSARLRGEKKFGAVPDVL